MRLNIFLPSARGQSRSDAEGASAGSFRAFARRALSALGPSWLASPVRRAVQTLSFLVFLALFFYVCWPYGSRQHAEARAAKEIVEAEAFLAIDPLVSISTALAARTWVWSLTWAAAILAICLVIPRGFCGYLCPLGTLLDLFDWAVGRRLKRLRLRRRGWWVHLKYYVLVGVLVAAALGVLVSGFVAAIPVVTRGMMFALAPLQMGLLNGWHLVPPMNAGHYLSLGLFAAVLGLGLLRPRFWCRHVCPSGAVFSVANAFRLTERKVTNACIGCGRCLAACPFDAIRPDYTTRPADCTFCQTCGGVCPVGAIQFVGCWKKLDLKPEGASPPAEVPLSRRGFAASVAGSLVVVVGTRTCFGARLGSSAAFLPIRPPGSVPEREFLQLCIRCGECFKACPYNVLQPMGFEGGFESLWTPRVVADWSGCEPKCNNCGQVCPTGAIRALPLEEKRCARVGLAVVSTATCLPIARRGNCVVEGSNPPALFCQNECTKAGYNAIGIVSFPAQTDEDGKPVGDEKSLTPEVASENCNGCGLCQTRCHHVNVKQKRFLKESAIIVVAGPGNEDRLMRGSYLALRKEERRQREEERKRRQPKATGDGYLPDFLK